MRKQNRYHGKYFFTGDYTALKIWFASAILGLIVMYLDWGKILPAQAEFISPLGDSKIIEVEKIIYKTPQTIQEQICAVFKEDCADAIKIFSCESGLRANAQGKNKNGSTDTGIAQINSVHSIPETYLKNEKINILVAKQIYDRQGWRPWVCARKLGIK